MNRRAWTTLPAFLLLTGALAGCLGGGESEEIQDPDPGMAPTPTANGTFGSITGVVTSEDQMPVAGATLGLLELSLETKADASGVFTFNDLEPGRYSLVAERLGYESTARKVDVQSGQVTRADFELAVLQIGADPYHVSIPAVAHIKVGQVLWDFYVGWDLGHTCDPCTFDIFFEPGPDDVLMEAQWRKTINAPGVADNIYYEVRTNWANGTASVLEGNRVVAGSFEENPDRVRFSEDARGMLDEVDQFKARFGGGWTSVSVDQRVHVWFTFAYHKTLPDDFTALDPDF